MSIREVPRITYRDLGLVANGSVIVEGKLRVTSDGPLAAALQPPDGCQIIADFGRSSFQRAMISLLPPLSRQPDGIYDWRAPIVSLSLELPFPDLGVLRDHSKKPVRFEGVVDTGRFISVQTRYPADGGKDAPVLYGNVSSLVATGAPELDGLRLRIEGPVDPIEARDSLPALTDGRLECDVLLPWAYLSAVGSRLAEIGGFRSYEQVGAWTPHGPGLGELALSGKLGFFDGDLTLPGQRTDLYPEGPKLLARIDEQQMLLQGCDDLRLRSDGFVWPASTWGGPELELEIGHKQFARMLSQSDTAATLTVRGPGIGRVNGQTGRIYESGGPCTQEIIAYRVQLSRDAHGLRFDLVGELAPLPEGHWAKSLGPEFAASMFIPAPFIFLHKWQIQGLAQDRRDRFGLTFD